MTMTQNTPPTQQAYPKRHLFAASGVALLCLSLIIYPSREVEAKKTFITIELEEQANEQVTDFLDEQLIETAHDTVEDSAQEVAVEEDVDTFEYNKTLTVASGDTLSVLFNKAGISSTVMHQVLDKNKDAKRFVSLKPGQQINFEFDQDQTLQSLSSQVSALETIYLEKQADSNTFKFRNELATTEIKEKFARNFLN